jgi:hypothetical protein
LQAFPRSYPVKASVRRTYHREVNVSRANSFLAEIGAKAPLETQGALPMDKPVLNLAGTVKEAVTALSGIADVASALKAAAVSVASRVDQVKSLTADLQDADELLAAAVNGATAAPASNGPPIGAKVDVVAGPTQEPASPASSQVSAEPSAHSTPAPTMRRTPIGFVHR